MLIKAVSIENYRSIASSGLITLGPVTLLVGRNNSGKSALLRALYLLQRGALFREGDVRIGADKTQIYVQTGDWESFRLEPGTQHVDANSRIQFEIRNPGSGLTGRLEENKNARVVSALNQEPYNLIYPVLSDRRPYNYTEQVRSTSAITVGPSDSNLVSRVMSLATSDIPEARTFRESCLAVLGLSLNVMSDKDGQQHLGMQVDRFSDIPLDGMGTGISSALNLLLGLSGAKHKLFLIEEPENDLHPQALKALLDLIAHSSAENQFVISTHSSIVLTRLGSIPGSVVVHTTSDEGRPPASSYAVVRSPEDRLRILQDLGYELADFDLGEGWLIFEESSAERITREFLIPWFAPGLLRLRTLAAAGTSRLEPIVQDFHELFLFAHLEPLYRGRAWVIADGDESGREVTMKLRNAYKSWPEDRFNNLSHDSFEKYYPSNFVDLVTATLATTGKAERREAKKRLLDAVLAWTAEDQSRAKSAFEESAAEVIDLLRHIEKTLLDLGRVSRVSRHP